MLPLLVRSKNQPGIIIKEGIELGRVKRLNIEATACQGFSMPVIGVDIGGTKSRAVLWNGKKVVQAREVPTPENKGDFEKTLLELTSLLSRSARVEGVGIGAAGIVEKTTLLFSPNIPCLRNLDFRSLCPRSIPLRVDNDARAFARAELLRGAGRGAKSMFALTIGTGIGRAYGRKGKIVKLKRLEYPEPWEREYQAIRNKRDDKRLANFLAEKLSPLLKPFEPEVIVLGGGVMERHRFMQRLQTAFRARGVTAKVRRAALHKNSVAVGAALLFSN